MSTQLPTVPRGRGRHVKAGQYQRCGEWVLGPLLLAQGILAGLQILLREWREVECLVFLPQLGISSVVASAASVSASDLSCGWGGTQVLPQKGHLGKWQLVGVALLSILT